MSPAKLASATSTYNAGLPIRKKDVNIICYWLVSFVEGWGRDTNTNEEYAVFPLGICIF